MCLGPCLLSPPIPVPAPSRGSTLAHPTPSAGYCTGWGDPHYVTFDGLYYSYQGNCTYVLVEEVAPTVDNFGVYIDNYHCDVRDQVSCPRTLIVHHETQEVLIRTVQMAPVKVQVCRWGPLSGRPGRVLQSPAGRGQCSGAFGDPLTAPTQPLPPPWPQVSAQESLPRDRGCWAGPDLHPSAMEGAQPLPQAPISLGGSMGGISLPPDPGPAGQRRGRRNRTGEVTGSDRPPQHEERWGGTQLAWPRPTPPPPALTRRPPWSEDPGRAGLQLSAHTACPAGRP